MQTATLDLQYELTHGFAGRYIRWKARRLVGHANLKHCDRRDIEQELALAVFQSAGNFDGSVANWNAFAATVIERRAAKFLNKRRAQKRFDGHAVENLHGLVQDSEGNDVSLAAQLDEGHRAAMTGCYPPPAIEQLESRLDVRTVVATLPAELQLICQHLAHGSQRVVARRLNMSRRTLRDALDLIRERFEAAGLGENFRQVTAHFSTNGEV